MITVKRKAEKNGIIHGEVFIDGYEGEHPIETLEMRNEDKQLDAIPAGKYKADWVYTPIHRHHLRVFKIPRRKPIHIQPSNLPLLHGNIALGVRANEHGALKGSSLAFKTLKAVLPDEEFEIIMEDPHAMDES